MGGWVLGSYVQAMLFWAVVPFLAGLGFEPGVSGVALAAVPFTALAARIPCGRLVDRYGSRRPGIAGAGMLVVSALLYLLSSQLPGGSATLLLLVISLGLHGAGLAAMGTASFTYLGIVTSPARRGQATGYFGIAGPLLQGVAAATVYAVSASGGFVLLYAGIAAMAVASTGLFFALAEVLPTETVSLSRRSLAVVGRAIGLPAATSGLLAFTYGASRVSVPVLAVVSGISNPGLFFLTMAIAGVVLRLVTGGIWDRLGRRTVALPGLLMTASAFAILPLTAHLGDAAFMVCGALYGMAGSCSIPALQAMVLDRGPTDQRGVSAAAMWMLSDVGMGFGTLLSGVLVTTNDAGGGLALAVAAPLLGVGILAIDAWAVLRPAMAARTA
jgi:MFS family permease